MKLASDAVFKHRALGDEVHDGVVVERRHLLCVSLAALTLGCRLASAQQGARSPLSWDALLETAARRAEQLIKNASTDDEEAYLIALGQMIRKVSDIPRARVDLAQEVAIHQTLRKLPLLVVQYRLAPHAVIPYHDHRNYNGVLTVTEGTVRIRSFDIVGNDAQPKRGSTFQLRETRNALLGRGAQSTLSRTRENIHHLRAGPEGARFVDFFTLFRHDAQSAYIDVDERPRDSAKRIFDARWP
jgi:hypothetical protein